MDGQRVFDFAMDKVVAMVKRFDLRVYDNIVFHQSNMFILKQFKHILKIPSEKMVINIERFGNTAGVSIPLALVTEEVTGPTLCFGYGAGLTYGHAEFMFHPKRIRFNEI